MRNLQLSFHTTFPLKKSEVARVMGLAGSKEGFPDSIAGLMDRTGFGPKKVGPVKSWATRSGIIRGTELTAEGRTLLDVDPGLRSTVTEWLMHFHLSFGAKGFAHIPESPADWGGWTYLVFQFLPEHPSFTIETLAAASSSLFDDDPRLFRSNYPYALRAYTDRDALASCNLITRDSDGTYHSGDSRLPPPALLGYALAKLWERDFGETQSVPTDFIFDQAMGLGSLLGVGRSAMQEVLDSIAAEGFIEQRRTVAPFQVVRRWLKPIDLLARAYA
jgi:hypothetical protein